MLICLYMRGKFYILVAIKSLPYVTIRKLSCYSHLCNEIFNDGVKELTLIKVHGVVHSTQSLTSQIHSNHNPGGVGGMSF